MSSYQEKWSSAAAAAAAASSSQTLEHCLCRLTRLLINNDSQSSAQLSGHWTSWPPICCRWCCTCYERPFSRDTRDVALSSSSSRPMMFKEARRHCVDDTRRRRREEGRESCSSSGTESNRDAKRCWLMWDAMKARSIQPQYRALIDAPRKDSISRWSERTRLGGLVWSIRRRVAVSCCSDRQLACWEY